MARVTATEVKEVMDNCTVTDAIVTIFITIGELLIDAVFTNDTVLGEDVLKEVERFYVAHLVAMTKSRVTTEEKLGEAAVKYAGKFGMNLDATPYGQIAKQLDTTGKLATIGKQVAYMKAIKSFD
jgi:hypothetical protein